LRRRPDEGRIAAEQLVRDARQRVDVTARIEMPVPGHLLGAHVRRRAHRNAGAREPLRSAGTRDGQRDPEISQHGLAVMQQDIFGFDVAVQDAVPVRVVEGTGERPDHVDRLVDGQGTLALEPAAQRSALHQGHDVVEVAADRSRIEERQDVRVLELSGDSDFAEEPVGADDRADFGAEYLDRDLPVVLEVGGEVHHRHAALADLAVELVAAGEAVLEIVEEVGHDVTKLDQPLRNLQTAVDLFFCIEEGRGDADLPVPYGHVHRRALKGLPDLGHRLRSEHGHDGGPVSGGREQFVALPGESVVEALAQGHGVRLDAADAYALEVGECRRELLHRTKSPAAVVELPGGLIELEVVVGKLLFDLEFTVPVDLQALEHLLPYIEGSDAETGQHPLVRPRADGIHTRRLYIQLDGPEALDDVRVQDGAMRVGQVGEGTQVMAKSVQVGHPRHRHDAGPAVDEGLEVLHTDGAVAISRDSELDPLRRFEGPIQDELGRVVEVVDHDVVARLELHSL